MDVIIVGPTASGKTALSVEVAVNLGAPIISADARQCYRGMDIGTAKPSPTELSRAPHFNISILDPDQNDDAASFVTRSARWKQEHAHPHWIIVGGSTLYLQSLMFPLDDIPKSDPAIQAKIEADIRDNGLQQAWDRLSQLDPLYAMQMDGLNHQRIVRALCVHAQTDRAFSSFHNRDGFVLPENTIVFGLQLHRDSLVKRINQRVDAMIEDGLVDEVKLLQNLGFDRNLNSLKTVGYTEVFDFLEGKINHSQMVEQIKAHTRQYSRRQMTWFRRWPFIEWIDMDALSISEASVIISDRILSVETQRK
jgi:tRNA dimethylallyltransferase